MTIKYLEHNYLGFQEYINSTTKNKFIAGSNQTLLYAHPVDKWILATLNTTPIKAAMNKAIDAHVSFQFGQELASKIFIDQKSFPDIFLVLSHCAKTLDIPIPHAVAGQDNTLFNAYTAGTDEYAFINISSGLCQFYSIEEACFIIGHECGHIAAGHMTYHTLARVLTDAASARLGLIAELLRATAGIPLMAWSRRSEVTADRAGLLCCGDINIAIRALLRFVSGVADINRVDVENYLRKSREVRKYHQLAEFHELFQSHPEIPKRIEALRLFANSEPYYSLSGKPKPVGRALLTQEELNRQVNKIIS